MSKDAIPNDSVSKCLRTLLLLASRESIGVSDLSRELDLAVSTAHRLLNILRIHEFAEQDPRTRRYLLGPAALSLGRLARGDHNLLSVSWPHLEQFCAEIDETINLVVLDGPDALFVDGIEARQPLRVATRKGARVPAYAAAGGKVLLAQLPRASVRARYASGLTRITERSIPDLGALEVELDAVRLCGYALNIGEHLSEVNAIAVAIEGVGGRPIAALTVAAPSTRWGRDRLERLAPQLHDVASRITMDLRNPSLTRTGP
ncbi:MAG TPA: IclR family transcriptional regulator [Acidimicrobiales bacterium]|nr:IclR family transcriptional regulator [Acidimicrobiales bacterium]